MPRLRSVAKTSATDCDDRSALRLLVARATEFAVGHQAGRWVQLAPVLRGLDLVEQRERVVLGRDGVANRRVQTELEPPVRSPSLISRAGESWVQLNSSSRSFRKSSALEMVSASGL